ncbi:unnamed protein product [Adineta steineri]|uniref:Uncharacterized protein n=1 Tax=Adineta steineri TaxID=433720 RepID=A0A815T0C1_9BILA|nr:unnamed protein product [Adineta steineri]CAF3653931.1 unnamed protein product [Adineta steineri]
MFLITVPITTLLTSIAMLIPYWWLSDTFQVGLWRARSLSSSWIVVEPQIDTQEGRLLFILQILSFISVLLTNLCGLIWLITLIRQTYHTSLKSLLSLLFLTILTYLCLSTMIFFVWSITKNTIDLVTLTYSFYLTLIIILFHTITLISITINLAKYRTNHHAIQPYQCTEKISFAFNEPIV